MLVLAGTPKARKWFLLVGEGHQTTMYTLIILLRETRADASSLVGAFATSFKSMTLCDGEKEISCAGADDLFYLKSELLGKVIL